MGLPSVPSEGLYYVDERSVERTSLPSFRLAERKEDQESKLDILTSAPRTSEIG